jgi:hypothetical protein
MQAAEALLIGFLAAFLLVAVGAFVYLLWRIDGRLRNMQKAMAQVVMTVGRAVQTLNQTSEAIRGLSGLLVNTPARAVREEGEPWQVAPPPVPNPAYEEYAAEGEAGYMEQTDEDLAEIERQQLLREQGIETDPDRIPVPEPSRINLIETE